MPLRKNLNTRRYKVQRKKNRKYLNILILLILLGLSFLVLLKVRPGKQKEATDVQKPTVAERVAAQVEKVTAPPKPKKDPTSTVQKIETYLASQTGEYGYSVTDLETGESYGSRQDYRYIAASTVKVGVAAYVYKQIELGKTSPEKLLTYTSADYETGTGSLQGTPVGSKYKVSYLLERMLKVSDNVATNILFRTYGRSNIQAFLNQNGLTGINLSKNEVSPAVMASLLQQIYDNKIVSASSTDSIFTLMKGSITQTRLVAGVPAGVPVAHKIGTQVAAISDIGIVYLPDRAYAIAVYSKKVPVIEADGVIKTISKYIYEYESQGE